MCHDCDETLLSPTASKTTIFAPSLSSAFFQSFRPHDMDTSTVDLCRHIPDHDWLTSSVFTSGGRLRMPQYCEALTQEDAAEERDGLPLFGRTKYSASGCGLLAPGPCPCVRRLHLDLAMHHSAHQGAFFVVHSHSGYTHVQSDSFSWLSLPLPSLSCPGLPSFGPASIVLGQERRKLGCLPSTMTGRSAAFLHPAPPPPPPPPGLVGV